MALTELEVRKALPGAKIIRLSDGGGLQLPGRKAFVSKTLWLEGAPTFPTAFFSWTKPPRRTPIRFASNGALVPSRMDIGMSAFTVAKLIRIGYLKVSRD